MSPTNPSRQDPGSSNRLKIAHNYCGNSCPTKSGNICRSQTWRVDIFYAPIYQLALTLEDLALSLSNYSFTPFLLNTRNSKKEDLEWSGKMTRVRENLSNKKKISQDRSGNVSAIFVHAGAGFHSGANEHTHLEACNSAAKIAMRVLKAGGSAVDAVEVAIKVLEDKEITNAGYGSNLAIDGVVECDATIVDHLGRSGACGATAQIKNPIMLARAVLKESNGSLSLHRVPPNLLVGQGATDFACAHGISVLPNEMLVSKNAHDRYVRWRYDLNIAEGERMTPVSSNGSLIDESSNSAFEEYLQNEDLRDYKDSTLNRNWNESRLKFSFSSPCLSPKRDSYSRQTCSFLHPSRASGLSTSGFHPRGNSPTCGSSKRARHSCSSHSDDRQSSPVHGPSKANFEVSKRKCDTSLTRQTPTLNALPKDSVDPVNFDGSLPSVAEKSHPVVFCKPSSGIYNDALDSSNDLGRDEDLITDTVGAIAIDMYGNIAAGSSSGGIGMKNRGRIGPAALVGVGSAVIPVDEDDEDRICVATVTSGTGEHMLTTMASQKCADRLYNNTKRTRGGKNVKVTEEEAIKSFILNDFMGHPGVRASSSTGALGVMGVKKMPNGYFLYFAHNTESFALASMHSNEKYSKCVMSRLGKNKNLVMGARKISAS